MQQLEFAMNIWFEFHIKVFFNAPAVVINEDFHGTISYSIQTK